MKKKSDIRQDVLTREEWKQRCVHYVEDAFYTPPREFLFHHYDELTDRRLICHRPMIGIEKYVVQGELGDFTEHMILEMFRIISSPALG